MGEGGASDGSIVDADSVRLSGRSPAGQEGRNLILQKLRSQELQKSLPALNSQSLQESILRVFPPEMRAHGASVLEKMIKQQPESFRSRSGGLADLGPGNIDLLRFGSATMRSPAPGQLHRPSPQRPSPQAPRPGVDPRRAKSDTCLAEPQDRELERRGGSDPHSDSQRLPDGEHRNTSECTTESDSEKDAAESFMRRQSNHGAGLSGKRAVNEDPSQGPRKIAKRHHDTPSQPITSSEMAAAKEHHDSMGGSTMYTRSGLGHNASGFGPKNPGGSQQNPNVSQSEMLQQLTTLLAQQHQNSEHARSNLQASPFQDKPRSPQGDVREGAGDLRNCYSEGNAQSLRGEQSGAVPVTTTAAIQNLSKPSSNQAGAPAASQAASFLGPLLANPSLANYLVSGHPNLPGVNFQTVNSDVASDLNLDLSRVLGYQHRHHLAPIFTAKGQEQWGARADSAAIQDKAMSNAASLGGSLGAFGSITPVSEHDTASLRDDAKGKAPLEKPQIDRPKPASGFSLVRPTQAQVQPSNTGFSHPANSKALESSAGPQMEGHGPDPRILDWVLGNRATIMNKAPGPSSSTPVDFDTRSPQRPSASQSLGLSNLNPISSSLGLGGLSKQDQSGPAPSFDPSSTLSRPRAIRAGIPRAPESMNGSMDPKIEALMAKLQSSVIPHSAPLQLQSLPKANQPLNPIGNLNPGHPKMHVELPSTNTDIGRVVQWAGQELALRDSKVREAERQRDEERTVHDAAMSAVATEVMRIKAGQQELAKTHWNLQDMLSKKTAEAEDQRLMVNHLAASKEETVKELKCVKEELQLLKEENIRLQYALRQANGTGNGLSAEQPGQALSDLPPPAPEQPSNEEARNNESDPSEFPPRESSQSEPGGIDIPVVQESRSTQFPLKKDSVPSRLENAPKADPEHKTGPSSNN